MKPLPPNHTRHRWLPIALTGLLCALLVLIVKKDDNNQREVLPERVGEQKGPLVDNQATPKALAKDEESLDAVDPQWLVELPVHGANQRFVIDPSQVFMRDSTSSQPTPDLDRVVTEKAEKLDEKAVSSLEDLEELFVARARETSKVPNLVLFPENGPRNEKTRRLLGQKVAIELANPSKIESLAKAVGATSWRKLGFATNRFILEAAHGVETLKLWGKVKGLVGVVSARPLLARRYELRYIPRDPLYKNQWHLEHLGQIYPELVAEGIVGYDVNARNVWNDRVDTQTGKFIQGNRGEGVVVSIVDDGLESLHPDLQKNANTALDYDYYANDFAPFHDPLESGHGTAVAGILGARGNNRSGNMYVGAHGVAPDVTLLGARLISGNFDDEQSPGQ